MLGSTPKQVMKNQEHELLHLSGLTNKGYKHPHGRYPQDTRTTVPGKETQHTPSWALRASGRKGSMVALCYVPGPGVTTSQLWALCMDYDGTSSPWAAAQSKGVPPRLCIDSASSTAAIWRFVPALYLVSTQGLPCSLGSAFQTPCQPCTSKEQEVGPTEILGG